MMFPEEGRRSKSKEGGVPAGWRGEAREQGKGKTKTELVGEHCFAASRALDQHIGQAGKKPGAAAGCPETVRGAGCRFRP
ncbi:MAG: winged helix-turn-helix domain-containing protein [Kiritimatiellae bacterium]|nr:winged helix-turn-helix domain-containing protein [Kiritimatiellia bacterium]